MKRLIAILLLAYLLPLFASAEGPIGYQPAEIRKDGICISFLVPEGVSFLTGRNPVEDWAGLPESYVKLRRSEMSLDYLHGLIAAPGDAMWEIQWGVFKGVDGDLDELSEVDAEQYLQRKVTGIIEDGAAAVDGELCWMGNHRYTCIRYESFTQGYVPAYVVEYYTRQNGWNVLVMLTGYRAPAPDAVHDMLAEIVSSQVVTAE